MDGNSNVKKNNMMGGGRTRNNGSANGNKKNNMMGGSRSRNNNGKVMDGGRRRRRGTRKNQMGGQNNTLTTGPQMGGQNNTLTTGPQMGGAKRAVGTHAEVWHGTADHTSGGLKKGQLMKNKHGRIISKKKHALGKKALKHLVKAGFKAKKGTFKLFRK